MSGLGDCIARDRTLSNSSDRSESENDPHFEAIVRLPEVQVSTNEENEVVLLKLRAKLYRFDTSNDDGPEWKERGTGEVKLLRHKKNNSVRVVMRRDKTFKVCANHFITPWMELKPNIGSDKAFVYKVVADFADELPKSECLAIKFANVEIANQFKDKFNEAKNIVSTKCKLYIAGADESQSDSDSHGDESDEIVTREADELTEKLITLNVSNEKSEDK